jgi:hypothetical protein
MSLIVQYVGFEAKVIDREYSFRVQEVTSEPREVTFKILNEAFHARRIRYQDAPDLCSLKLHRELADSVNHPLKTQYRVSDTELQDYRESHGSKAAKGLYSRKAKQDF